MSAQSHAAYVRGRLEITVTSYQHENLKHLIATLVELLAGELEIDIEAAASTTFQRGDLARGSNLTHHSTFSMPPMYEVTNELTWKLTHRRNWS